MDYFDSSVPSVHDLMTGFWTPTTEEKAAGLGHLPNSNIADFCTVVALIKYQIDKQKNKLGGTTTMGKAYDLPSIASGKFGQAIREAAFSFGVEMD
jgi:hypothetical protein